MLEMDECGERAMQVEKGGNIAMGGWKQNRTALTEEPKDKEKTC